MRQVGLFCILLGGGWCIVAYLKGQDRLFRQRRSLLDSLYRLEEGVRSVQRPLPELFALFSDENSGATPFYAQVLQAMKRLPERPLSCHWYQAAQELPPGEKEIFSSLASAMDGDGERIQKALSYAQNAMEQLCRHRDRQRREKAKLWCISCVSLTLLAVLFLY